MRITVRKWQFDLVVGGDGDKVICSAQIYNKIYIASIGPGTSRVQAY